ncbi:MAG TPA: hypothetical protein VJU16_08630 [Planctomycetota bacterium]|nr:hypothetical protein [Planctomycetota bacterium]
MSVAGSNGSLLMKAMKDLLTHWEASGNSWRDKARTEFDKDFIQELVPAVRGASRAAVEIENLLQKVRSECS